MPSQSMKEATKVFLHTCLPNPFLSQQEAENPKSKLTTSVAESRRFFITTTAASFFPMTQFTSYESLPSLEDAYAQFVDSYPEYSHSYQVDEIRAREYYHLSLTNHACLDYIGIGLFAFSQFHDQLCSTLSTACSTSCPPAKIPSQIPESPPLFSLSHRSVNLKSELLNGTHESIFESSIKERIMAFLNISADDYSVVFTANRTSAFKLLAESYPFHTHKKLLRVYDHQSEAVDAMIASSAKRGAKSMAAEFTWPRLRIRSTKLKVMLTSKTKKKSGLFAFQLQSRVTGGRYSYQWMQVAQENGWHVLLDACALAPKDMGSFGLSLLRPDFLVCSFYKVFGENPTGFGCLIVKKTAIQILEDSASVGIATIIPAHTGNSSNSWRAENESKKTPPKFRCLDHVESLGHSLINRRGRYLTNWLINALTKLRHPGGESEMRVVRIYGPKIKFERGAAVAFNVFDWKGERVDPVLVQKLGDRNGVSMGNGAVCGEEWLTVVTVAIGYLVDFKDVYRVWGFIANFLDAHFVEKERWRYTATNTLHN